MTQRKLMLLFDQYKRFYGIKDLPQQDPFNIGEGVE